MQTRPVAKSVPGSAAAIELRSQPPFAVGVVLWRDEANRVHATVVAKATYSLAQGTSEIVEQPDPIRHPDEYWEDGAAGSLQFPSDLAPFKASHEVVVVGHVYANESRPTQAATARFVVGGIEKMIEATVPRRSERDGQLQVGPAQTRFSLRYELAAGCPDNPVGIVPTDFTPTGGHIVPQLVPANLDVRPGDYVPMVGFGPVSRSWQSRDSLLRPEDREWLLDPLRRPRPTGFDPRYFCAAPIDQRSAEPFRADERLILEGLHPTHARLVTNLGGVAPALRSVGPRRQLPPFVADTIYIDTDRQIATVAFRATVPLDDAKLALHVVAEGYGEQTCALGGDATAELERSAIGGIAGVLRSNGVIAEAGEGTAELDRSAFIDAASTGLPFPPSSEPGGRAPMPSTADGALPFRPFAQPVSAPQASPAPLSPPPPAPPSPPPLVSPPSTFGLSRMVPAPEPPRADAKDPFRKAFGLGAESGAPKPLGSLALSGPSAGSKSTADAAAALDGIKAALLAASGSGAAKAASDAAVAAEMRGVPSPASPLERTGGAYRRSIVDLLALEPTVASRLRRSKTHAPVLAVVAPSRTHKQVDAKAAEQTPEERARIDVLRVLSCGTPLAPEELNATFDALLDDPNDFDVPLLLVEGDVKPTMDEVETLRVAVELAKPIAGNNKRVQSAVATASETLARSVPPLSDTAAALYKQLEAATSELSLPSRYFADLVDRTLLEARSFKKRTLLGALRIRAELTLGRVTMPIYLPESAASLLPLLPVFPLAALVELRPREDASEPAPAALIAFAFGRVLRARK